MLERVVQQTRDLNINELVENGEYTRRALMTGSKTGMTALEKGFFTFYFKDCTGNLIVGRKFDLKDYIEAGFDVAAFKNKLVTIDFKAQIFNGSWSLVVNNIKIADDQTGYEDFIGKIDVPGIPGVEKIYSAFLGEPYSMPIAYLTESIPSVCQGKSGGVALLFSLASKMLSNYRSLPTVDAQLLFKIFDVSFAKCYAYMKMRKELDVITNSVIIELLTSVKNQFLDNTELAIDCASSLMGLTQPQHLYSHLIYNAVHTNLKMLEMAFINNSLPLGSNTFYKGVNLLRY